MAKLSVIIPSRNEKYLIPTIESVFANARGEIEVVAAIQEGWPEGWKEVVARFPNLHTIHFATGIGMRAAINAGAASAISRGAKYLAKFDAHCAFGEGFDEIIKADMDKDWIVVPRRKRLDPDTFAPRDDGRLDIDYHFLTFPDNVKDFGGPGLNGRVWEDRARERLNKPEYDIDDEMSSQGSGWAMHAEYFTRMGFMDAEHYGQFWNEFQELGLSCWLSGGRVVVNKRTWYAHWHKGSAGRGYHLPKEWLAQGATFTKRWLFNEASDKQTLPFKFIIERFWPVPTWPENWEELVYGETGKGVLVGSGGSGMAVVDSEGDQNCNQLIIHNAYYGIGDSPDKCIDVTKVLQRKVVNNSLDICVTNADLEVGNPFRGMKKKLRVRYSYNGGEQAVVIKEERDWLIIGQSARYVKQPNVEQLRAEGVPIFNADHMPQEPFPKLVAKGLGVAGNELYRVRFDPLLEPEEADEIIRQAQQSMSAPALNDFLIRCFNIPSHRLRGPMPIEIPTFHRNDLAKLFAELGMNKGAEIGVAEGNYSEVLVKANPDLNLICVDPWHRYKGNPQSKTKEKDEYAYREAKRKLEGYNVKLDMRLSMDAVRDIVDDWLDFVYIDGHHGFDYVMQDLIEWSKKVRTGGLITGDDYYYLDPKRWGAGPVEAVQAYTTAHKITPWFIFQGHKSIDFMWVKQ